MMSTQSNRSMRFSAGTPRSALNMPTPRPSGWAPTPSGRGSISTAMRQALAASTPLNARNDMTPNAGGRTASTPTGGSRHGPEKTSAVKVAVRVRPFSSTERADRCRSIVRMQNQSTYLIDPAGIGEADEDLYTREFCYDYSYWSFNKVSFFCFTRSLQTTV